MKIIKFDTSDSFTIRNGEYAQAILDKITRLTGSDELNLAS